MSRERILQIYQEQDQLKAELERLLEELRKNCTHEQCLEAEYKSYDYGSCLEPMRICINCGFEQHTWDTTFSPLAKSKVIKTFKSYERDKIYEFRRLQSLVSTPLPAPLV